MMKWLPFAFLCGVMFSLPRGAVGGNDDPAVLPSVADLRLALMRERVSDIRIETGHLVIPEQVEPEPLFRYADPTRGVVDGTLWRLGASGRPFAIITAELRPDDPGDLPISYNLLSLTNRDFDAVSLDLNWRPRTWGVDRNALPNGPEPAESEVLRLVQMKDVMSRFTATQEIEGERVQLRRLSQPIHRYLPEDGNERRDGAIFLYVDGTNPGVVMLLETSGEAWTYWVGRLSSPSRLTLSLDERIVWQADPLSSVTDWDAAYTAAGAPADIPGFESLTDQ